jgi:hypothetical protein
MASAEESWMSLAACSKRETVGVLTPASSASRPRIASASISAICEAFRST